MGSVYDELRLKLENIERERDELQKKLLAQQEQSTASDEAYRLRVTQLETTVAEVREQLRQTETSADTERRELQSAVQAGTAELAKLRESHSAQESQLQQCKAARTELEQRVSEQSAALAMFAREVEGFTDAHSHLRLTRHDRRRDRELESALLDAYTSGKWGSRMLTVNEFIELMHSTPPYMRDTQRLVELEELFAQANEQFVGWMDVLAAQRDLYTLDGTFRELAPGGEMSRTDLKRTFEDTGLGFHKSEYLPSFNAIVLHSDASGDERINRAEFMKMSLMLVVLRVVFAHTDRDGSGCLSRSETMTALSSKNVEQRFITKVDATFDDYVTGTDQTLSYEGFTGVVLGNLPRKRV